MLLAGSVLFGDVQKAGFFVAKIPFTKPSFTPQDQLTKLKSRGLVVASDKIALSYLQHVGGYRLKGYYYHVLSQPTKNFPANYSFDTIAQRYEFDRSLRFHTFAAITRLEMAIRSTIANELSRVYGPHWFLKYEIFNHNEKLSLGKLVRKIEDETQRSSTKAFIEHYLATHNEPYLPPSWGVTECVTFGLWSLTFNAIKDQKVQKSISVKFKVNQTEVFSSWLHSITVLRNTVAHHSRLLKHKFAIGPSNLKEKNIKFVDSKSFYAVATAMNYLQEATGLPNTWKTDLISTFNNFPAVNISEIGFSPNWTANAGW